MILLAELKEKERKTRIPEILQSPLFHVRFEWLSAAFVPTPRGHAMLTKQKSRD
jgi:hypothetical protein